MKRLLIMMYIALIGASTLQAQWREFHTGVIEDLYGVCCISADTAFVCGEHGVILKTEDGGETWVEKNRTNGIWFNDIHFAGNIGYASGNQLFKTTDAGETWQAIWPSQNITSNQKSNSDVNKSDFFLIGTDTLYWYKDCIMKSSHDAGLTWNEANGVFADMETCKTFFEDNVGYIVVSSQMSIAVSKSTDYGQTWGLVFEKIFYNRYPWGFAVNFIDKDNVRIIPSTPHDLSNKADEIDDFVMFVTNDGFETFSMQTVENNGYYGVITDIEFSDANNGCYIAYQKWYDNSQCSKCAKSIDLQSFACVTKDGGQTWQFAYDGIDGAKKLYGIDGSDTTFYVTSQNGYVYRTGIPDTIYEWYDYLGDVYEPVIKPDVDSISWVAWSRNTEGQIVKHILYAKSYADSICFYDDTCFIGNLREDNGRLWIRYANDSENEYLIMDMTRNSGVFSFPSGNLTMVADVFYREDGRKVIVFDPLYSYSAEWKEQLMFIEGVGPNFLPITDLSNNSQYYLSCKFEDGENVYTAQNDLFDECQYHINIVTEDSIIGREWYYELQNPDGSITYQHLYYLADTVIDDRDIDIIVRNNTLYDKNSSVTTHEYIYEENGKVYWWNATIGGFTTLYDFSANAGDEWEIKVGTNTITMHVDAVGETEYNGHVFKTLQVSDAENLFNGTIVANVGHLTSFFPEKLMRKQGESSVEGLRCLWNGAELVFKYGDKDCDEVYEQLHDGLGEATTNSFSLYPNPTDGQLSITAASGGEYRITNLMGQTLLQGRLNSGNTSIDVSGLCKGMYFMTIEGRSKKFIVQ